MNKYTAYTSTLMANNTNEKTKQLDWQSLTNRRTHVVIEQIGDKPIVTDIVEITPYYIRIKNQNNLSILFRRQFNRSWRAWDKIPTYNETSNQK